ncbi:MAG TPA: type 4a pilus biogenesis protein PilO [Schlesneria sp.]
MKLLARHDTLIAIIGTAVLTGVYYLGVICPGHRAARDIKAELALTHARMGELPAMMLEQTRLQSELDTQREKLAQVELFLPDESHESQVLQEVAGLAHQSGLVVTRLEPLPTAKFASYSTHPFQLNCRGEFREIASFLNGLETRQRLVTFGSVALVRNDADRSQRLVQATVNFSVYSRQLNSTEVAENTISRPAVVSDN